MIEVKLYTREDCHLCDEVREIIQSFEGDIPLTLKEIDIDQNDDLIKKFGLEIPVIRW